MLNDLRRRLKACKSARFGTRLPASLLTVSLKSPLLPLRQPWRKKRFRSAALTLDILVFEQLQLCAPGISIAP